MAAGIGGQWRVKATAMAVAVSQTAQLWHVPCVACVECAACEMCVCVCVSGIINIYERCQKMQHVRAPVCVCVCGKPRFMPHTQTLNAIRYNSIWYTLRYMPPFGPQNMYLLSSKTHLKCHMRHMHKSTVHTWMPLSTHVNIISNTLYSIDEAVPKQLKVNKTTRIIVNFIMKCTKFRQIEMEYKKDL